VDRDSDSHHKLTDCSLGQPLYPTPSYKSFCPKSTMHPIYMLQIRFSWLNTTDCRLKLQDWRKVSLALHTNSSQSGEASPAIWNHTVSPARATRHARLNVNQAGRYLIHLLRRDETLNWPGFRVMFWDGLPVHRQAPIQSSTHPLLV